MLRDRTDTTPSWLDTAQVTAYPSVASDVSVDVVVVGGGVTGITAAYLLKQAGCRVALVERRRVAWGESGRSAAHISCVPEVSLGRLLERFGREQARAVWDAGFAAVTRIRAFVRDERINCQFSWVPGVLHATHGMDRRGAVAAVEEEACAAEALRLPIRLVDTVSGVGGPGLAFEHQAKLHPVKYLTVLAQRIPGDGSFVFEESEVTAIEDSPLTVRVGRHKLRTDYLIQATHAPLVRDAAMAAELTARTTFIVRAISAPGTTEEGLYWECARDAYDHLRVDAREGYDELIFGGGDMARPGAAEVEAAFQGLEARLLARIPEAAVTHRWSGSIIDSRDGLPLIGETGRGRFTATALGGNGFTYGTLAGMMAADAVDGRPNAFRNVFDLRRAGLDLADWTPDQSRRPQARGSDRSDVVTGCQGLAPCAKPT